MQTSFFKSFLILSSSEHLGFPSDTFSSGFWVKMFYAFRIMYQFFWHVTLFHWIFAFRRFDRAFCPHFKGYMDLNHCLSNVKPKSTRYFTVFYVGFPYAAAIWWLALNFED
jgi:hypothetical protein